MAKKPIYVVQHTLSEAACKARNDVVPVHLQYGIDKPSQAFAQLPIFTKSKLITTEHCVLFDDSANNSLNMISHGKLHNCRMVQGNSESPTIAQAFILQVLNGVPKLQDQLLAYIDNIYLKSTTEDMDMHIADVGHFICCLTKANVTVNMHKTLWSASCDVEVLGRTWSADHSWSTFDHHIETLRDLPLPSNLGSI
ncbi:hypothetical protein H4S08_004742 [Coemansia sp. RSA 1365]|nr:hypothetical protein H4S08_004742 [Coemansia sp. RSA 1365]